jgi:hypothetical protein
MGTELSPEPYLAESPVLGVKHYNEAIRRALTESGPALEET